MTVGADAPIRARRMDVCSDRGATSLAVALLTPVFVVLMFAAVQATLWSHARTEVRVAAADAAAQVARFDASPGDARDSVRSRLAGSALTGIDVAISDGAELVVVTILAMGDAGPAVYNAANEVAVHAFLRGAVPFLAIFDAVADALEAIEREPVVRWESIEAALQLDQATREATRQRLIVRHPTAADCI